MIERTVTIGPVHQVPYLEEGHCNATAYREVRVTSNSGRLFGFNKLLLASMSPVFREVMTGHFASPHYSHGDSVCILTEFKDQELEHLHQLCHYGRLMLNIQDSKPCLKSLGVDLSTFDMSGEVFDGTLIKSEGLDAYDGVKIPEEERFFDEEDSYKFPTPSAFLEFQVKQSDDYMDFGNDSNHDYLPAQEEYAICNGKKIRNTSGLLKNSLATLKKIALSHNVDHDPKASKQQLLSLVCDHLSAVHNVKISDELLPEISLESVLPMVDNSVNSCLGETQFDIKNYSVSYIRNHAIEHGITNVDGKSRKDVSEMLVNHYLKFHDSNLLIRKANSTEKKPCFQLDARPKEKSKPKFLKKQTDPKAKSWSEEVKASIFYFPTPSEMPRDLSLSWQCGKCSRGFQTVEGYRQHWWRHTVDGDNNRAFVCVRCLQFETSTKRALEKHKSEGCGLQRHVDTESVFTYYCALCEREGEPFTGMTFKTSAAYQRHLTSDHLDRTNGSSGHPVPVIDCSSCGRQFPVGVKSYLRAHISKSGPYHDGRCWACPKQFASWKAMQDHLDESHGGVFKWLCGFCGINAFDSEQKMKEHRFFCRVLPATQQVREVDGPEIVCTVCGELCPNTMVAVKQHLLDYHSEAALKCQECQAPFFGENLLNEHMFTMHRVKRFPCTLCEKIYSKRASLKAHMDVHGEPKFTCQFCSKKFHKKEVLYTHEKMKHDPKFKEAEDAKKKVCDICGWEGAKRNYLHHVKYNHMKEEMTCEQCGRKFKGKMHLQKHINKDHNFKQCTLCGVEVKAVYFKRHMLAKHTDDSEMPYQCSVCHKGFCKKQTYQSHMNIHTGEKPHSCRFCDRKFGDDANCLKHMRESHSEQWQAYKENKRKLAEFKETLNTPFNMLKQN